FSLDPNDRAESVAVEMLEANPEALVVAVVDATRIERGLNLVLELLERNQDVVVALNMWDEAREKNIDVDVDAVESLLGVPVVPTVATEGRGVQRLIDRFDEAASPPIGTVRNRIQDVAKPADG
ncbi:MAG: FeoB small GTPase domain-containing protein, partial [Halobacteriales archaeon]